MASTGDIDAQREQLTGVIAKALVTGNADRLSQVPDMLDKPNADVNGTNEHGQSLAFIAAQYGRYTELQALIARGARIDRLSPRGQSPVWIAACMGQKSTLELLLQSNSVCINTPDDTKMGPLAISVQENRQSVLPVLLKYGADVNAVDTYGRSVLDIASSNRRVTIMGMLRDLGAFSGDKLRTMPQDTDCSTISVTSSRLDLSNRVLSVEQAVKLGARLAECSELESLDLSYASLTAEHMAALAAGGATLPALQTLALSGNALGGAALEPIAAWFHPGFKTLQLSMASLGDEGCRTLSDLLMKASDLRTINLTSNSIGPAGAAYLSAWLNSTEALHTFFMPLNLLGDEGAATLAEACTHARPAVLDFNSNKIGNLGLEALCDLLPSCHMHLECNPITKLPKSITQTTYLQTADGAFTPDLVEPPPEKVQWTYAGTIKNLREVVEMLK